MTIITTKTLDEIRENYAFANACGSDITWNGDGEMFDAAGHPVTFVHKKWVERALRLLSLVSHDHRVNPEGFIPTCAGCGQPWPCAIASALEAE